MTTTLGRRLGEGTILTVYLGADAIDLWPKSHIGSFVFAYAGILGILLFDGFCENVFPLKRSAILGALAFVGCLFVYAVAPLFVEKSEAPPAQVAVALPQSPAPPSRPETEITGTIQPADDPSPPNPCEGMGHSSVGTMAVYLGTNVVNLPNVGKSNVLTRRGTVLVAVERTQEGIYIDAKIFDAAGKLVGTVDKNKFTVLTGENTYVERRGDLSTFGVYDKSGTEFLYVRFLNPKAMRIRGIFYFQGLPIARITNTEIQLGGMRGTESCFGGGNIMGFD